MKVIEVEWEVKPKSALTQIELSDLGCKNKNEWDSIDSDEQEKRINNYLLISDKHLLIPLAVEWEK